MLYLYILRRICRDYSSTIIRHLVNQPLAQFEVILSILKALHLYSRFLVSAFVSSGYRGSFKSSYLHVESSRAYLGRHCSASITVIDGYPRHLRRPCASWPQKPWLWTHFSSRRQCVPPCELFALPAQLHPAQLSRIFPQGRPHRPRLLGYSR